MEKKTCGPLGGRGSQGGIQDSFRDKAPTVRHPSEVQQLLSKLYKRESVGARDSGIGRKRSSRASSFAISRVLQSDVRCSKSFRCLEASNRSLSLKQKGEENVVQDGDPTFGPSFDQTRRLDVLDRSEGCVPSSSNSSTVKTSSQVLLGREGMAVQGHVFRPFHSTAGFHKTDGPSFVDSSLHGSENLEVSGRLADTGQFTRISSPCKGISDGIVRGVGHHNKSGEVRSDPEAGSNLLGNEDSIYDFEGFSDTEKDRRPSAKYRGVCQSGGTPSVAMVETHRDTNLSHDIGTNGQAQDTPTTVDASQTLGQEGQQDPNTVGPRGAGESSLVVTGEAFNSGSVTENPNAGLDVFLGRFRPGLGSSLGRGICIRRVVRGGEGDVNKLEGAESNRSGPSSLWPTVQVKRGGCLLGQLDSNFVSQKRGRNKIHTAEPIGTGDYAVDRAEPGEVAPTVCEGQQECRSRFLKQGETNNRDRMDISPGHCGQADPQVASNDRSICNGTQLSSSMLLQPTPGRVIIGSRCNAAELVPVRRICIPTNSLNTEGAQQAEDIHRMQDDTDNSVLATEGVVRRFMGNVSRATSEVACQTGFTKTTAHSQVSPQPPNAAVSCLETIKRFARTKGVSFAVARKVSLARRTSTNINYQHKWKVYRKWCKDNHHTVSRPTVGKVADFLLYLRTQRQLSVSAVKGYKSMLASVFKYMFRDVFEDPVLTDLLRAFEVEVPKRSLQQPPWDLDAVLKVLAEPPYEPMGKADFRALTKKTIFLLALSTAKRLGELQALSASVARNDKDLVVSYLPEFRAKTETESNPLPREYVVKSLSELVGGEEPEKFLCPVRAMRYYLDRTKAMAQRPRTLFVSLKDHSRPLSKNSISFLTRQLIWESQAVRPQVSVKSRKTGIHSVRGYATSVLFWKNTAMSKVLRAATWKSNSVFASYYLKDVQYVYDRIKSLGPIVAAGDLIA